MQIEPIKHHFINDKSEYLDKIFLSKDVLEKAEDLVFKDEGVVVVYDDNAILLDNRTFSKLHNRFKSDFVNYHEFVIAINEARTYFRNLYKTHTSITFNSDQDFNKETNNKLNEMVDKIKDIHNRIDLSLIRDKYHTASINQEIIGLKDHFPSINENLINIVDNIDQPITSAFKNIPDKSIHIDLNV